MSKLGPALDVEDRYEAHRRATLLVSFLACFALQASTGAGQTVGTMTGAINGAVIDSTSAVLPGVTIVISSAALMGTRTTLTIGDERMADMSCATFVRSRSRQLTHLGRAGRRRKPLCVAPGKIEHRRSRDEPITSVERCTRAASVGQWPR